jgi:hypothetical protein
MEGLTPVQELNCTDADVSLFFLSTNDVKFNAAIDDPLFSAHKMHTEQIGTVTGVYYTSDNDVTVLGCVGQHQYCDPSTACCTALTD